MNRKTGLAAGLLCFVVAASASAQVTAPLAPVPTLADVERVRTLYGSAAYEDALAAMPPVESRARTDIEQYRALCLLALGRDQQATAVVERLVNDNPTYLPADEETTPRLRTIFSNVRSKLIPDLAKRAYSEAKISYEAKNLDRAATAFRRTLDLIGTLDENDKTALADLSLLAGEFLKLASPSPAAEPATPASPGAPFSSGAFVAPVTVREQLPGWIPPDSAARRTEYAGVLRIEIDAQGKVTSATVVRPSHPAYDAVVIMAAKRWVYRPATRGGQPVPSSKDINLRLIPK
jgi:TonB family protein